MRFTCFKGLLPFLFLLIITGLLTNASGILDERRLQDDNDVDASLMKKNNILVPRQGPSSTPTPCPQNYVCPTPLPYPGVPDTGTTPPDGQFKCRIGQSVSDPDFAFCYYDKNTGALVGSTPSGIEGLCWGTGMRNPECPLNKRSNRLALPKRVANPNAVAAHKVEIAQFAGTKTTSTESNANLDDNDTPVDSKRQILIAIFEKMKLEGRYPQDAQLASVE